ncbi:MAG TPA: hypothetical protein VJU61_29200, partial [Polyangiaceae bacterium]|nr:hypothetical protein [Polyangiaceae bacterium]
MKLRWLAGPRRAVVRRWSWLSCGVCALAAAQGCWQPESPDPRDGPPATQALRVTRGELSERVLLTGELDTVASENLAVPRVPQWNIALR